MCSWHQSKAEVYVQCRAGEGKQPQKFSLSEERERLRKVKKKEKKKGRKTGNVKERACKARKFTVKRLQAGAIIHFFPLKIFLFL